MATVTTTSTIVAGKASGFSAGRQALRQLAGSGEPVEPTSIPGGTLRIHFTQFFLLPGIAFKVSELLRQARAAGA